jgi:predicted  nucleic acid-binding Zn-ribbon protein
MNQSLEQELDIVLGRMSEIEKNIIILQENQMTMAEQLKETQKYLIRIAKNQSEISKRISQWPFIAVPLNGGEEV